MNARIPVWLGLLGAALNGGSVLAAIPDPLHPSPDAIVESRLLPHSIKQAVRALLAPRRHPDPVRLAARVRGLLEAGRQSGDPRLLSYAEATLAEAGTGDSLPLELRVLRASLAQSRHDFEAARQQLDEVLREDPEHPQALLTSVAVDLVQGRLDSATRHCEMLSHVDPFLESVCQAQVAAASGQLDAARNRLQTVAHAGPPALRGWVESLLGEVELRAGHYGDAQRALRASLALGEDHYTRVLLADALLASHQPDAARHALDKAGPTDAVLLRRALAHPKDAIGQAATAELQARIAIAQARGDRVHAREQAWFALDLANTPAPALALAQANWTMQHEPIDAWLLARAAVANGDHAQLAAVRTWAQRTGLRDARLMGVLHHAMQH